MGSWLLKTALQRVISALPHSEWWNGLLQRYVTGGLLIQPHGEFQEKLRACQCHFDYYQTVSRQPREDFTVLEVGTGWFPIIPIGLHLCGAREVWTFDIVRLLRPGTFSKVIDYFCRFAKTGELYKFLPAARPECVEKLVGMASSAEGLSPVEFLERLHIHAQIQDVRRSGLPDGSVDLVLSHGVLEHFPPGPLADAFAEFRRLSSDKSVMCHYLGIADQFAACDKSITPFNNMRYSARVWRWLDSPMIPQNRLRVSDYVRAYREAGFEVAARQDINGVEQDLASIHLAPEFAHYSRHDLLVLFSWLVARSVAVASHAGDRMDCARRV